MKVLIADKFEASGIEGLEALGRTDEAARLRRGGECSHE